MGRRWLTVGAWCAFALVCAAAGVWAGRSTLAPPRADLTSSGTSVFVVSEQTVGRSLSFPVQAHWETSPLGTGAGTGTLTTVAVASGDTVDAGSVLYSLDLRPVVLAEGTVPAFRDLVAGSQGADVAQLRAFLAGQGYLRNGTDTDKFTAATTTAVKRWQKHLGVAEDGVVRAGDLLYAVTTPARVALDPAITVGARVAPGTVVLDTLSEAPSFTIDLAGEQASLVPTSGPASVVTPAGTWDAVIASADTATDGTLHLHLDAPDHGPVCGQECAEVAVTGQIYTAQIVVVPQATGPAVPAAAITTGADGATYVTTETGKLVRVTVISSGDGRAVVDGLAVGDRIRLFGANAGPLPSSSP